MVSDYERKVLKQAVTHFNEWGRETTPEHPAHNPHWHRPKCMKLGCLSFKPKPKRKKKGS